MDAIVSLSELKSELVPNPVPYAVISPPGNGPFPLCLFLHGGGGSRDSLLACKSLFENWWAEASIPPMVLASPSADMSYYVEDAAVSVRWDSLIVGPLLDHLQATANVRSDRASTAIMGMSMGGYGALKIAFAHPERFAAVAALAPVIEPGLRDREIGARNKLHYGSGGPDRLIGPGRDDTLFILNNPANRAISNRDRIRREDLAIYLEAGDDDFINVHDGSEFLHRILWDLDISHEYRLIRGADHVGPTLLGRMHNAFSWLGSTLTTTSTIEAAEAAKAEDPMSPTSRACIQMIREQLRPSREAAAAVDETTYRRYGIMPDVLSRRQ